MFSVIISRNDMQIRAICSGSLICLSHCRPLKYLTVSSACFFTNVVLFCAKCCGKIQWDYYHRAAIVQQDGLFLIVSICVFVSAITLELFEISS